MSGTNNHVVVIGGGVVGAACAYYLAKAEMQVTILDKGSFGKACSHANCGYVSPSHVLPLAGPEAMKLAFSALFKRNFPVKVRPGCSFSRWNWLRNFAARCNEQSMLEGARAIKPLLDLSRPLFSELIRKEKLDCEWQEKGMVFVFQTEKAFHHFEETNRLLTEKFDSPAEKWSADELSEREPALRRHVFSGGYFYKGDAHLRPDRLMKELRRVLTKMGVTIQENSEVSGFEGGDKDARRVITTTGSVKGDHFVVATGAWTPFLQKELGCKIPIQPGKGVSLTMPRPKLCPKYPLIFEEHRVAVTPMESGYRLGSTMEIAGYSLGVNPRRIELLKDVATMYLREPLAKPIQEEWYGWRPMTYDSVPIIDRSESWRNVWIASGHNMLGLSMATGTGKLISEMITKQGHSIDTSPYTVKRF